LRARAGCRGRCRRLPRARRRRDRARPAVVRGSDAATLWLIHRSGEMKILVFLLALVGVVHAQDYPSRPITVIVPFSTGSASDVIARIMLERMNAQASQRFIVDNRPAAGGAVGTAAGAKAAPDGYTILMAGSGPFVVAKNLQPAITYDAERDFAPI